MCCLNTYEHYRFWMVEEHHAQVLDTRGHDAIVFYIQSDLSRIQGSDAAARIWGGP